MSVDAKFKWDISVNRKEAIMLNRRRVVGPECVGPALAFFIFASSGLGAVDFIRGDANGDGRVSISDAQWIFSYIYRTGPLDCLSSGDLNNDGTIDYNDGFYVFSYSVYGLPEPAAPFPHPGLPEGDGAGLGCEAYGGGSPLDDPQAKLEVLEAIAPGGSENLVLITLAVTNIRTLAGFSGTIATPPDLLDQAKAALLPRIAPGGPYHAVRLGDSLNFALLTSLSETHWMEPGQGVPAMAILACLHNGTPAGEYPLMLEGGELIDWESGQTIQPLLGSSTLTVLEDVTTSSACLTLEPADPLNAVFKIGKGAAPRGGSVALPFTILADRNVQGFTVSVDFDEEVLEATQLEWVWERPSGEEYFFQHIVINNQNRFPGGEGVEEGYLLGAVVFALLGNDEMLPNINHLVARFHFQVRPETTAQTTTIRFLDGARSTRDGPRLGNVLTHQGQSHHPEVINTFILVGGEVKVLDGQVDFIRGDSNSDGVVDIRDAKYTLSYLFQGGNQPHCYDAADFNDDGNLNLTDPIVTLLFLFLKGEYPSAPFPEEGKDPTQDSLECLRRGS